jgi:hypothetical protein
MENVLTELPKIELIKTYQGPYTVDMGEGPQEETGVFVLVRKYHK